MDWESWLRSAAQRPSDNEDSKRQRTEDQIRQALCAYEPLQGVPYRLFTKGSYANNTNVRLNFDVDIAVEYNGYFYSDLMFDLEGQDKSVVGVVSSDDPYTREQFKDDIIGALHQSYGKSSVEVGKIAYRIREGKTTLPADVVPCWEYRRYDRIDNGSPVFQKGSRVYPSGGGHKNNYPDQQLASGTKKNTATSRRYKRMVRALKKLQTRLVAEGKLESEILASYLIECIVYNVPNENFGHSTYKADMRAVLAYIFNETLSQGNFTDWHEVNELKYLFRAANWNADDVHRFASEAWDLIGY